MNTKITLELTPEQIRFLRYVAELEGLTVEQYLLRFAKGQIVRRINSQKSQKLDRKIGGWARRVKRALMGQEVQATTPARACTNKPTAKC